MRVVVTGGRFYADANAVHWALWCVNEEFGQFELCHGGAPGADTLANTWAFDNPHICTSVSVCKADWDKNGKAAGPIRNRAMLEGFKPDLVIAFPGGAGTADCVRAATKMGLMVRKVVT